MVMVRRLLSPLVAFMVTLLISVLPMFGTLACTSNQGGNTRCTMRVRATVVEPQRPMRSDHSCCKTATEGAKPTATIGSACCCSIKQQQNAPTLDSRQTKLIFSDEPAFSNDFCVFNYVIATSWAYVNCCFLHAIHFGPPRGATPHRGPPSLS